MTSNRRALARALALVVSPGLACDASPDGTPSASADLVVRGVTVLSPSDGSLARNRTVLVSGDRIVAVLGAGEAEVSEDARVVDGAGLYLMPGLWDFHTHLSLADANAAPLMVTQGVTGARDLGGILGDIDALRDRIARGEVIGPRIVRAGPTLNGAQNGVFHRVIDTAEAAREAVADLAANGVDFLKTHNATEREPYFALLEAASEAGLDVVGHIPTGISPLEACEAGQASIDHIVTIFEGVYIARFSSELEAFQNMETWVETEAPGLVECFARKGTLFVPTLRTYEYRAHRAALYDDPPEGWRYLTAESRIAFRETRTPSDTDRLPQVIALRESVVHVGKTLTKLLWEAGAPIGTGTDFAAAGLVPGFSLHRELELLAEAGLPQYAAIWASARGPGQRAGAHPLTGHVEVGAPADLVLLRENPFERIQALSSIEAVILGGRLLDRSELDRMLSQMESG